MSSLSELPHSLERLYRLGLAQVFVGFVGLYLGGVTAATTYSKNCPAPTAYIKSEVRPLPSEDPASVVKLRNNGGGSFDIISMKILSKNQKIESFGELFKRYQGDSFSLSSESDTFIKSGHVGRNIAGLSSLVIAKIRPSKAADEEGREWEKELRKFIASNDVEIELEYTSLALPLPLRTALFTEKKRFKL